MVSYNNPADTASSQNGSQSTKKPGAFVCWNQIFRRPGCLRETQWAFRPTLADGLVVSIIGYLAYVCNALRSQPINLKH